jgi:hypothetical protein
VGVRQKEGAVALAWGFVQRRDATGKIGQAIGRLREAQPEGGEAEVEQQPNELDRRRARRQRDLLAVPE